MKTLAVLAFSVCLALPAAAMKNRHEDFTEPCDVVWKAAVAVAKSQEYRIVSIASEEQILSLDAGGIWWGERIISLSLAPGAEHGCTATVQSRYSGLQHSDGPDLLARIHVQMISAHLDKSSEAVKKYQDCLNGYNNDPSKCYEKLKKRAGITDPAPAAAPSPANQAAAANNVPAPVTGDWWEKPATSPAPPSAQK